VQAGDAGLPGFPVSSSRSFQSPAMPQVSVRDTREDDRGWIQRAYREYLVDLAPTATGLYPMLGDLGGREPDPLLRLSVDANAHLMTVCYADERAGFAKINATARRHPGAAATGTGTGTAAELPEFSMAEFFIAQTWRRRGIGSQAVRLILDRFTGRWLITEHLRNDAAVRFWRHVVTTYTGGKYQERIVNGEVQQRFVSGSRRPTR
jgi:GNAT superfamily N-acetyltransferase